jgi:hypothetical protein
MRTGKIILSCLLATLTVGIAHAQDVQPEVSREAQPDGAGAETPMKRPWFVRRWLSSAYFWRVQYYFVAQNTKNCDVLYGLVKDDPLIGFASVNFKLANGCECSGHAKVTHHPMSTSTAGQRGWIHAKCADGRTMKGTFTTISLTKGSWQATDSLGNYYEGNFGQTAEQALERVNEIRKANHCEECSPREIELKVQGKILPPGENHK